MNDMYLNTSFDPNVFKLNQFKPTRFVDQIDAVYTAEMYEEINFFVPPNHFIEIPQVQILQIISACY